MSILESANKAAKKKLLIDTSSKKEGKIEKESTPILKSALKASKNLDKNSNRTTPQTSSPTTQTPFERAANRFKNVADRIEQRKASSFGMTRDQYRAMKENPDGYSFSLKLQDGTDFGEVSYDAYQALLDNKLDDYKPKTDAENTVLSNYKNYVGIPFSIDVDGETKNFGNMSYNGLKAVENNALDAYAPVNEEEKKAIAEYKKFTEEYGKEPYTKYAKDKSTDISGIKETITPTKAEFLPAPEKSGWDKLVDGVKDFFALPEGSLAKRVYDEATGFKDNNAAWSEDQMANLAIRALHNSDNASQSDYGIIDEAYARLSASDKYKDSDLIPALREARKSWGASPGEAAWENVKAAVAGMGGDFSSFLNSIGADKIPIIGDMTTASVEAAAKIRENAARYNKGRYGEDLGQFTQGVTNLVPYLLIGSGKAAEKLAVNSPKYLAAIKSILTNPSFYYSMTTMWGQKYQEALGNGADRITALSNAIAYAIPSALVEVSGGIGAPDGLEEGFMRTFFGEIGEELAQDIISGVADKATAAPDLPYVSLTENAVFNPVNLLKTAVSAAPVIAVGGGTGRLINNLVKGRQGTMQKYALSDSELADVNMTRTEYENHTEDMKNTISGYIRSVDTKLKSFIQQVRSDKNDNKSTFQLNELSDRMVSDIKNVTGIDATGFGNEIKANSIRHIEKSHGVNGVTDHTMKNDNDIARIQYVLDNYDSVTLLDTDSKEYIDKNGKHAPLVKFSKRIDGMYYVVEAVPDTSKQKLEVVSAYKTLGTQKETPQPTVDENTPTTNARDASADNVSVNNIPQLNKNVNASAQTETGQATTPKTEYEIADENAIKAAYEAGKANVPLGEIEFVTTRQKFAYNQGRMDAIQNMPKENSSKNTTTGKISQDKPIVNSNIRISEPSEIYNDVFYGTDGSEIRLTNDEKSAINKYKGSESYVFNEHLRDDIELTENEKKLVVDANSALDKFPTYTGTAYRNIGFRYKEDFDAVCERYSTAQQNGEAVIEKAFTSSSKSPTGYEVTEAPYTAHFVLESKNGKDVSNVGINDEFEVLFKTSTEFDITSVEIKGNEIFIKGMERAENGNTTNSDRPNSGKVEKTVDKQKSNGQKRETVDKVGIREGSGANSGISEKQSVSNDSGTRQRGVSDNQSSDEGNGNVTVSEREVVSGSISDTDYLLEEDANTNLASWTTKRVGEEVKPKSISEIVAAIEHEYNINVTIGHIRGSASGIYMPNNHGIRTKIANDLPTTMHELGHYFERTLGIKEKLSADMREELEKGLTEIAKEKYSKEQLIREGIAEYTRRFFQNREIAANDYPLFTDLFLKQFTGRDLARIEQLADDINAYYSLDADAATSTVRLREEGAIDLRTPIEKLKDYGSSLYQAFIDANHSIRKFDKATGSNAYVLASNAAYSDAIAGQIITSDLTDQNGRYVAPGLKTVLHGIDLNDKETYRLFGEYLIAKHAPERFREGMRVFADDRKNNTVWVQKRQSELEKDYPQFKEVSEKLYDFMQQFYKTWGVGTGLISEEMLNDWNSRWKYYVPFNRVMENENSNFGAKRGFANQDSTIKKARGSGRDIYHPVDNLIDNIVKMVNAGVRNNVMLTITESAEKLGADATFLEKVPMPMSVTRMDMSGVKENLTNMLAESDIDADDKNKTIDIVNSLDDILLQYGRGKAHGNVITVLKNGSPQAWKVNDTALLESLTSLSPKTMDGILDAYAITSRFITANITGTNLVWSIFSNLPRDTMTFFTYSKNKNVAKMAKGVAEAYANKFKEDKVDTLYKEFLAMGGGKTSVYTSDRNLAKDIRKTLARKQNKNVLKKVSKNPLDWIGFVSDTVEAGPRFATYKLMRQDGMSQREAFYEAMDITVNFRRGGRISRELNKVVPFFNASVQGLDKFYRWITAEEVSGADRKKSIKNRTLSYIAVGAALAGIIYAINNYDEEKEKEYEQLSTYTKNSFWNIPIGDGKYFAIPKPREIGVLSSFFETCIERTIGGNKHAFDEFSSYAAENLLPAIANDIVQVGSNGLKETGMNIIGSFGMIGVFGYMGANRDFLGRPIVSAGLQNLEPKDQYTDRTSKIAYWIGQAGLGSPQEIDYFFQQTLGGWWKYQKALLPVGEKNRDWSLGVMNTYIKDNQYSLDLTNWLYERADKTSRASKSNPTDIEKAIEAKWDSNMTDFYGIYYKKAKNNSKLVSARSTRQLVLDTITEYQKGIDNNYKTSLQKAVEDVCKTKNSKEYLPSVMPADVTDGNENKHSLSDVQYVEYQTDYLRLYWEIIEDTMTSDMTTAKKAHILKSAKIVARERATERTLNRICASTTKFAKKYDSVDNDDLTVFLSGVSEAGADGKTEKKEVVDIILDMNVDNDAAWDLYLSKYSTEKSAIKAKEYGIDAKVYMTAVANMSSIKADYKANGKAVSGSRKAKIQRYLNSVCNSYKGYLFLLGTEYSSVKKSADYISYFGKEED